MGYFLQESFQTVQQQYTHIQSQTPQYFSEYLQEIVADLFMMTNWLSGIFQKKTDGGARSTISTKKDTKFYHHFIEYYKNHNKYSGHVFIQELLLH